MSDLAPQLHSARQFIARGNWAPALGILEACARARPEDPDILYCFGRIHKGRGDLDAAERCYRRALEARPEDPNFWTSLGILLRARGELHEALDAYHRALAIDPTHLEASSNLARALAAAGDPAVAAAAKGRAETMLRARLAECRAAADDLWVRGRPAEALTRIEAAMALDPASADLRLLAARLAADAGALSRSFGYAEQALDLDPHSAAPAEFARQRSCVAGLPEPAMRYAEIARVRSPSTASPAATKLFMPAVQSSAESIGLYRRTFESGLDEVLAGVSSPVDPVATFSAAFFLAYHGENDRILQSKAAQMYLRAAPGLAWTAPHCLASGRNAGKIRVGFISKFLCEHSIGKTSRGLIEHLDRDRFEVHAIRITPSSADEITRRIFQVADRGTVLDRDLGRARAQVAALGLDVLFYQDIGLEPTSYFLAFARLARVQCVSFGHPNTTGIPNVDYFVSNDLYEVPDAQAHYSEQLFLLHDLPTLAYYHRPAAPTAPASRGRLALPPEAHLYLCPQSLFKLHPDFDALARAILNRDPDGLLLLIEGNVPQWTEMLRTRFSRTLDGLAHRVRFLPRLDTGAFLALLRLADVILDTVHFNGMNSSLEALAMGTPVVTLPTRFQRGRHTQAMYRRMNVDGCVASTPGEYVDIAVRIATDRSFAKALRARILAASPVLFEDLRVVREFERFFAAALDGASGPAAGSSTAAVAR